MSDLTFEKADYGEAGAPACANCGEPRGAGWFRLGEQTFCARCQGAIAAHWERPIGSAGYAKAIGAGIGAGVLGAAAWAFVTVAFKLQLGIVAIAVGWAVAHAMRWGAGRGGRVLQVVAVLVTYVAIAEASVASELAMSEDAGIATWLFGMVLAVGLVPWAELTGGGVNAILWAVIVGIALNAAWRRLAHPTLPWVGPHA